MYRPYRGDSRINSLSHWKFDEPEEIAVFAAFPADSVVQLLPEGLNFVTLESVAPRWRAVREYLDENPDHASHGVSFVAILRPERFELNDRDLVLIEGSAIGQWWAYVDSIGPTSTPDLTNVLALGSWLPDTSYADFMVRQGLHAEAGNVSLTLDTQNRWLGTISLDNLVVQADCVPAATSREIPAGRLRLISPKPAEASMEITYVAYNEQVCTSWNWTFKGTHPLATAAVIGEPIYLSGFDMRGILQP